MAGVRIVTLPGRPAPSQRVCRAQCRRSAARTAILMNWCSQLLPHIHATYLTEPECSQGVIDLDCNDFAKQHKWQKHVDFPGTPDHSPKKRRTSNGDAPSERKLAMLVSPRLFESLRPVPSKMSRWW
jgi:hypothetical protein